MISKFNSSLNEWQDSIYTFNKNGINYNLYNKNLILYKLLNNYFNSNYKYNGIIMKNFNVSYNSLFNINRINRIKIFNKEHKLNVISKNYMYITKRKKALLKWKEDNIGNKNYNIMNTNMFSTLSLKRIFINLPYIKHNYNNISIIIFLFNKNRIYLKNKLKKLKIMSMLNESNIKIKNNIKMKLMNKDVNLTTINSKEHVYFSLKKILNGLIKNKLIYSFFKRTYLGNIYSNNVKFNYLNLINLKNIIYNIYNKKVIINLTNIKYIYLENNIFIDNLTRKLNDRKKGILKVLKKALKLIKIAEINPIYILKKNKINEYIKNLVDIKTYLNYIDKYSYDKSKAALKSMKNIHITGISIEAKGRLTRRMTASRSVYKLKFKGNLKNIYSCYYNISTSLLRGFIKSNMNTVRRSSKNKNGSYGITSSLNTF